MIDVNQKLLVVKDLSKTYKSKGLTVKAVDDLSFTLKKGETLSIVGESGCGKSTTGKLICRLIDADTGLVTFNNSDILQLSHREFRKIRPKIQMVFQDPYSSLNPRMTIRKLLEEPIKLDKTLILPEINKKINELITVVGLDLEDLDKYPHEFSGGQRQRISIARAIANEPQLMICDEPVSALDLLTQGHMLNLLKNLQKKYGFSYLFISHDLSVVKHISDRIGIMYQGSLGEMGQRDQVFNTPKHPYTKLLLDAMLSLSTTEALPAIEVVEKDENRKRSQCKFALLCSKFNEQCISNRVKLERYKNEHHVACCLYT